MLYVNMKHYNLLIQRDSSLQIQGFEELEDFKTNNN